MISWQELLAAAALVLLMLAIRSGVKKHRERKTRDFTRKLEMVLLPRERVKLVCTGKDGTWILTSRRLLREESVGFTAIWLTDIRSVHGRDKAGKKTRQAEKMEMLTVRADREWTIPKADPQFPDLCKALVRKMEKKTKSGKTAHTGKEKRNGKK